MKTQGGWQEKTQMTCTVCGAAMEEEARFCPSCGAETGTRAGSQVTAGFGQTAAAGQGVYRSSPSAPWNYSGAPSAAPPASRGRVVRNLRLLATLWLVYAGLRAIGGAVGLVILTAIGAGHYGPLVWMVGSPVPQYLHSGMWIGFAVPAVIVSTLIACGLALATGLGLQQRWRSARILALIAGVLALFKFPLGTAMGLYTLWVLAPSRAGSEYDAVASRVEAGG